MRGTRCGVRSATSRVAVHRAPRTPHPVPRTSHLAPNLNKMEKKKNKPLSKSEALELAKKYCDYQERCQQEVFEKLVVHHLSYDDIDEIISDLIEQGFLNELRFATAFARGKFRIKHWGKKKIAVELKKKKIPSNLIIKALNAIDNNEYINILKEVVAKKYDSLKSEKMQQKRMMKTAQYAISRGFESDLVWDELNQMFND